MIVEIRWNRRREPLFTKHGCSGKSFRDCRFAILIIFTLQQSMATSARYVAIETLFRLDRTKHPGTRIFQGVADLSQLDRPDRQLAMNLVFGVLRHRDQLDFLIGRLCRRPPDPQQSWVRQALYVGLYQLFFLDRIPPFAAVNETVRAMQTASQPQHLRGFVNGVLRTSLRRRAELQPLIDPDGAGCQMFNHPSWLTERWQNRFGMEATAAMCRHNNSQPMLGLRVCRSPGRDAFLDILHRAGIAAIPGDLAPDAVLLSDFQGSVAALPGYHEGHFQIQDQSAQLVTLLLAPFANERSYLDCCAGVGGKTTHLIDLLSNPKATVTAIEPDPERFRLCKENLMRITGSHPLSLHNETLQRFARTTSLFFDNILVDAPCSGTGVIGRQPDIRWNRRETDLLKYQQKQSHLLDTAATLLATGGTLVYATCSIEADENEQVIAAFLQRHPHFALTDCRPFLPEPARRLVVGRCFLALPARGRDGFFAARLTRTGIG